MNFHRIGKTLVAFLLLTAPAGLMCSADTLPVVELKGNEFYVYKTSKGETLFGVARKNGWNDSTLQQYNSDVTSPLPKGINLFYPVRSQTGTTAINTKESFTNAKTAVKYTVAEGDSWKSLANSFGVSVAALMIRNPGLIYSDLKKDREIIIPKRGEGIDSVASEVTTFTVADFKTYKADANDTWASIGERYDASPELVHKANPGLSEVKKNSYISVPIIATGNKVVKTPANDERELSARGIREIYDEVHKVRSFSKESPMQIAIVCDSPTAKKDLEFIRGFMTGLSELKGSDDYIRLSVIDGSLPENEVLANLRNSDFSLIFLTSDKTIPSYLSGYAKESRTPLVNVFDVKNEEYLSNPYILQLLTPSNDFNESVAKNIKDVYGNSRLIFVGNEDSSDLLAANLRNLWEGRNIVSIRPEDLSQLTLDAGRDYLFYGFPVAKDDVEYILNAVKEIKDQNPFSGITLLGRPNWIVYDESLSQNLHQANTIIPSRFYIDEDSYQAQKFNDNYKELFDRTPMKSVPLFAGVGYDNALYFIPGLQKASNDINRLSASSRTLQNQFDFERIPGGGLVNRPVYMIRYAPDNNVDWIVIE